MKTSLPFCVFPGTSSQWRKNRTFFSHYSCLLKMSNSSLHFRQRFTVHGQQNVVCFKISVLPHFCTNKTLLITNTIISSTLLKNFRSKTPIVVMQQLHPLLVIRFTSLQWRLQTPTCHHYWITKPPLWRFESLPESNHQIWMHLLYHHIWSFKRPHLDEQNSQFGVSENHICMNKTKF